MFQPVLLLINYNTRIIIKTDIRTIRTTDFLCSSDNNRFDHIPFFNFEFGMASLTEATMMSPIPAYFRFEPPKHFNAKKFLGARIICYIQYCLHLYHY